jgi:hypothetical protein
MSRRNVLSSGLLAVLLCCTGAASFAATADADTVRTNLWVAQALMTDILEEAFAELPEDAAGVLLEPAGRHDALDLMQTLAYDLADERGLPAYLGPAPAAAGDEDGEDEVEEWGVPSVDEAPYALVFRIDDIEVEYPRVGRRLGLWRTRVDRECSVSAIVMLRDRRDGLILHDGRAVRSFGDRLPAGMLDDLGSEPYAFTQARVVDGGGIHSILEEVVVLGALSGLIAAYFATTAD